MDNNNTSKEKILDSLMPDSDYPHYHLNNFQQRTVYEAMDEYARIRSVGFVVWLVDNYSIPYEGFSINKFNDKRPPTVWTERGVEETLDELYIKYESYLLTLNPK